MKSRVKFYRCKHCGNIVEFVLASGEPLVCCGEKMEAMVPNKDGAPEKHMPFAKKEGDRIEVLVGHGEHPLTAEHTIEWIALETNHGIQRKYLDQEYLSTSDKSKASFCLIKDKPVAVYAYCNLHGLWMDEVKSET